MDILNCEMEFECPMKWEALAGTENDNIRHCHVCKKDVHFCRTWEELDDAIIKGWCIAYKGGKRGDQLIVGMPDWEYYTKNRGANLLPEESEAEI